MIRTDLHLHTCWCDGKNSPEEMVLSALELGMECIGFSGHSYTFFDESYCMSEKGTVEYREEIGRLKEKYRHRIRILCGIEKDFYSLQNTGEFDYVIGSVHYLKKDGVFLPVDESAEKLREAAKTHYGGDLMALAEDYYATVARVVEVTGADIIGHFDLISKFVEKDAVPDVKHPRYVAAWKKAADRLLQEGKVFEINTGAISRGFRTRPYPEDDILSYLKKNGARFILASDSHRRDTIGFGFSRFEYLVEQENGRKTRDENADRIV